MCEICDARVAKLREASELMFSEKRAIEAKWYLFRMAAPPDASEEEINQIRRVYIAGAADLFDTLMDCPTPKALARMMTQVDQELDTEMLRNETVMGNA